MAFVATRYAMENVLKIGYPCSCHVSPFESESYTINLAKNDPVSDSRITHITAACSNCRLQKTFEVTDRWLTEYDFKDLM
ncbi:MAG: hypothetical protein IKI57_06715 [Clostridia bacterium]|nr:hypothetical protein [Clostridia bacterium]